LENQMALGTQAAVESVEIEAFANKIPSLIPRSSTFYSLAQDRFNKVPVSFQTTAGSTTRPSFRVPFRVQGGAYISQGTGDGDSLGRGNQSVWGDFALSPVWHYAVCESTTLAQLATTGKQRSRISLKAEELKNSLDSAMAGLEGICYGDSSGAITQIPTGATVSSGSGSGNETSFITGIRAMAFTDNQIIQVFPSEGGSSRGTATVSVVQPETQTVWFSTVLPSSGGATAVGDYLMIAGSSGALNQGVFGTTAWINSATTGTIAGYNRATYPGRISSPSINLDGGAVVASLSQRIEALLGRAMGGDNKSKDSGIFLIGEDQSYAIAQTQYYAKQITQNSDDKGSNKVPDASRKYFQARFGDRESHVSYVQPLGRIDLLLTDDWSIGELLPLQLHNYGNGQTTVPVPDPDGNGWLTSSQFAYVTSFNFACSAPRHQLYVYGASNPTI
jgi:hypothetical protein